MANKSFSKMPTRAKRAAFAAMAAEGRLKSKSKSGQRTGKFQARVNREFSNSSMKKGTMASSRNKAARKVLAGPSPSKTPTKDKYLEKADKQSRKAAIKGKINRKLREKHGAATMMARRMETSQKAQAKMVKQTKAGGFSKSESARLASIKAKRSFNRKKYR